MARPKRGVGRPTKVVTARQKKAEIVSVTVGTPVIEVTKPEVTEVAASPYQVEAEVSMKGQESETLKSKPWVDVIQGNRIVNRGTP